MADEQNDAGASAAEPEDQPAEPVPGTVNSQIVDSVSMLNMVAVGQAPAAAAGMVSLIAADSLALGMLNAVARQQADATIAAAAVAAVCARMAGTSFPAGPSWDLREAEAQAQAAILTIRTHAAAADGEAAKAALQRLAEAATTAGQ